MGKTWAKAVTRIALIKNPEKGDKGETGAIRRVRKWVSGMECMPGGDGCKYEDFVYYNGQFYSCQKYIASSTTTPYASVSNNTGEWKIETSFNFLATAVFYVGEGEGWIIDGGVIRHTSGKIKFESNGSLETSNGKFKVDADGNLTAKSGTFSGYLISEFKTLNGTVTLSSESNIKSGGSLDLTLPTSISFAGRRLLVVDANFPPYTKSSLMQFTYIKVANGYLHGLGEYSDLNTPAYTSIEIRGGVIELVAVPNWNNSAVFWIVKSGHDNIIDKQ